MSQYQGGRLVTTEGNSLVVQVKIMEKKELLKCTLVLYMKLSHLKIMLHISSTQKVKYQF